MKIIDILWARRRFEKEQSERRAETLREYEHQEEWLPCPDCDQLSPPEKPDGHFCLDCGIWF